MGDTVEKTDTTGESKADELNLDTLFPTPESKQATDKTGETEKDTPSPGESEDEDPKELHAKLDAMTKELSRVRKVKTESSSEVQELRERLANIQGQLEVMSKGKAADDAGEVRLAKYTDDQLLQGQTEWEDEISEYRATITRARAENDDAAYGKATKGLGIARATLTSIRKELLERSKRVGVEQVRAQTESNELVQEIAGLYETTYKTYPELKDKDSDLWQAGNEVYNRLPKLMKQLGPMAELVATSIAITENPALQPKGEGKNAKAARKDLLSEINAHTDKSFIKGQGTPNKKVVPDFGAMPKDQFDSMIHKLKQGG